MAKRFPLLLIGVLLALLYPACTAVAAPPAQPEGGPPAQTEGNNTADNNGNEAGVRIMLPAISGQPQETPPEVAEDGRVYGLLGTLLPATEQSFATYLELADGRRIGLVGSTPSIETEIITLRGPLGGVPAKVWGIYRPATATAGAVIIVTDILPVTPELPPTEAPTAAPTAVPATPVPATPVPPTPVPPTPVPPTPTPEPIGQDKAVAIVMFDLVNVRTGPGNRFPPSGQVVKDQVCDIIGRNELETWYLIDCLSGARGWMDKRLVEVQGNTELVPILGETTDVAVVTPTPGILPPEPTPSPTPDVAPAPVDYWKATFFNNTQLLPPVALSATAGDINFNWGGGAPHPAVTSVNFSARFERAINYAPGFYRIMVQADDGVRVYLDGELLIDEWHGGTNQTFAVSRKLDGLHVMTVEYYQASGGSNIHLWQEFQGNDAPWQAQYFGGIELQGVPVFTQPEVAGNGRPLDYTWGTSSPAPSQLAADFWSGRWVGQFQFESGNYIFNVISDDGVRLYLNDTLVIDRWSDGYVQTSKQFIGVGEDRHTVRVEFYDRSGNSILQVWWYRESGQQIAP
ncbi:MAG: hypothetical protein KDD83_01445 [Caldilineaceae bacterium]|nr:hypothetical protein [Caldilineaceae bacterium]